MKKLDKLILGSFLGPFLLTFVVVDFILLTVNMLKYFDEIFGKGLSFWIYMELIGYFVISISPMALPLAVLLSSLMTFGNLGEHFELTAIKSSGISLLRALRPIGVFVIVLAFAAYLSNNYLVPKVNLKTFSLLYDIRMKSPALEIKEGVFYNGIPGYSLKVNSKPDEVRLNDIIIYNHSDGQGNLNVTMADSGRMEPFFNENYMKLTLYQGQNYKEARSTRGISEKPVEFSRTKFKENVIIFDLDAFKLNRTPEDLWSTNRSIKNIGELKLGMDSINTLVNDQKFQNYQTAESIYPFFTRNRKLVPLEFILERRAKDDTLRQIRSRRDKAMNDSIEATKNELASIDTNNLNGKPIPLVVPAPETRVVASNSDLPKSDSVFRKKKVFRTIESQTQAAIKIDSFASQSPVVEKKSDSANLLAEEPITTVDTAGVNESGNLVKPVRTTPLTSKERFALDSVVKESGLNSNALTMALNNARNLKNNFNVKTAQIASHDREFRRYEIAWYQKYTQAFACFVMFMIGAPLGAIIKKGGLGMPVILSITFFILFYMLTITGEKWAKEGVVDPFIGTWFSNLCLIPFGLFFLRQARKDARLFEPDFYLETWKAIQNRLKVISAKVA
ncbi:MAG: LptF/LptG family permease [Algoriphagus sp.]|nr:LptF/LptG family permease [Algoriphagus sp.]